jgi:hypothetical protein
VESGELKVERGDWRMESGTWREEVGGWGAVRNVLSWSFYCIYNRLFKTTNASYFSSRGTRDLSDEQTFCLPKTEVLTDSGR